MKTPNDRPRGQPAASLLAAALSMVTAIAPAAMAAGGESEPPRDAEAASAPLTGSGDDAVRRAVAHKLKADSHVDIVDLQVVVQDGIVTLHGRVANSADKHIAARYAKDVRGARGVVNVIDVVPGLAEAGGNGGRRDVGVDASD
jgi:osmotically-inducible protein OsmY